MRFIPKPTPDNGEYAPYAIMYIDLLPDDGLVLKHLEANLEKSLELLQSFSEEQLITPHKEGEWTIKEIYVHMIDDERIYAYRALRAARNDLTELPGFDPDDYAVASNANERSLESIIEEYRAVRRATITLFKHLPEDAFTRASVANGHAMSVRAAIYHLAGHELHHLESIQENYL